MVKAPIIYSAGFLLLVVLAVSLVFFSEATGFTTQVQETTEESDTPTPTPTVNFQQVFAAQDCTLQDEFWDLYDPDTHTEHVKQQFRRLYKVLNLHSKASYEDMLAARKTFVSV